MGRQGNSGSWNLPGGTIEKGESPLTALKRELLEEVDVQVKLALELGILKVHETDLEKSAIYQARYLVTKYELQPQTLDLATGSLWQRKFIPILEVEDYVDWGTTGQSMFADALSLFETTL